MELYKTRVKKIAGTRWVIVSNRARFFLDSIVVNKRRKPFIRSVYFSGEKIFLHLFWLHVAQKSNIRDKIRRMKFLPCAIDLIKNSKKRPKVRINPNVPKEELFRFYGITLQKEVFCVQIKKDVRTGRKYLMSVFPK